MLVELPLKDMSIAEKLQMLEIIWSDLEQTPSDIPSPDWRESALAERKEAIEAGEISFLDWEDSKERLRKRLKFRENIRKDKSTENFLQLKK